MSPFHLRLGVCFPAAHPLPLVQEVAFRIGNLAVHWYGILVAIGFMAGVYTAGLRGRRQGINPEMITDLALWIFGGAFLGARILYVITFWGQEFAEGPWYKIFALRAGFVFYGGLIGATLAAIGYTRWKKLPTWKFGDALAPSISLGHAFGRLGCLMTGCCFGKECALPWAVKYPFGHPLHEVPGNAVPVHPVQVYEALLNFSLYALLAWLYRRKKFDGQIFALYLLGYACIRAFVELFRGDYPDRQMTGWMTPAHWVSIGILGAGAGLYTWLRKRPQDPPIESAD